MDEWVDPAYLDLEIDLINIFDGLLGYWMCRFGMWHRGECTCPNKD